MGKDVLKKIVNRKRQKEERALERIRNNEATREDLFKYAKDSSILLFLLKNRQTNIIHYITKVEHLFIELKDGKTIIELYFEQYIKNPSIMKQIKEMLSKWETIPLDKRKVDPRKGKKLSPRSFNLNAFLNLLDEKGFLDRFDKRGIPHDKEILREMQNTDSVYKTTYFSAELYVREYLDLRKRCWDESEITEFLLEKHENGYSVLDLVAKSNLDKKIEERELKDNEQIAKYYLDYGMDVDLLAYCSSEMLLKKVPNDFETFFDRAVALLMQRNKLDMLYKIHLPAEVYTYISIYLDKKPLIKYIIDAGKLDEIMDLKENDVSFWLHNLGNKTMLEYLISVDAEKVLTKVINSSKLMMNPRIHIIANKHIINKQKYYQEESVINGIVDDFSIGYYGSYSDGAISYEDEDKIRYFREIMIEDGKSDIEIIELACHAFKTLYVNNNPYADRELDNAILLKTFNDDFCLEYDPNAQSCFFDKAENKITMNSMYSINAFNHELAHATHYVFKDKTLECPVWFQKALKSDPSSAMRLKYVEVKKDHIKKRKYRESKLINPYFSQLDLSYIFADYQATTERLIREAKASSDYNRETIEFLLAPIVDEKEHREILYNIISYKIDCIISARESAIEDIMDAIFKGRLYSLGISIDGKIEYSSGHGEEYYKKREEIKKGTESRFSEIFADYAELSKMPNNGEAMGKLKYLVGEKFFNALEEFYQSVDLKRLYNLEQEEPRMGGKR